MRAKAVIFDFGRVLAHYDVMRTCKALSAFCSRSPEEVHDAIFKGEGLSTYRIPYEVGAFPCEEFFGHLQGHVGLAGLTFADFQRNWPDIIGPAPGTERLLARVRKGVRLGILSNIDPGNWAVAASMPMVRRYFPRRHCTLSFEEKCRKPEPEIYAAAARNVGVEPMDTLYIDRPFLFNIKLVGGDGGLFSLLPRLAQVIRAQGSQAY